MIPELEIPRHTTRSVNTSEILNDPIQGDKTTVLQPTPNLIAKSMQNIKDCGNWLLDYIPSKPKVVDEALESFKNVIEKLHNNRDASFQLKESKYALKNLRYSIE